MHMSEQVVRVEQFHKGSLGNIGREVERENKESLQHRNEDIDISRTCLNYIFKKTEKGMTAEWHKVAKNLNVFNIEEMNKKKAIAFEGMIITSDKKFFEDLGYMQGEIPCEKVQVFFDKAYDFAISEIGFNNTDKNILSAIVHNDETTPHLQIYFVPVVDTWKDKVYQLDESGRVVKNGNTPVQARDESGKIIYRENKDSERRKIYRSQFWQNKGGKNSYTQMQDRFYKQISEEYGLGRGDKGGTNEHQTKQKWQGEQQKEKDKALTQKENELDQRAAAIPEQPRITTSDILRKDKIEKDIQALKRENMGLKTKNKELQKELEDTESERNLGRIFQKAFDNLSSISKKLAKSYLDSFYKIISFGYMRTGLDLELQLQKELLEMNKDKIKTSKKNFFYENDDKEFERER